MNEGPVYILHLFLEIAGIEILDFTQKRWRIPTACSVG